MVVAALISFAILLVAWIVAPDRAATTERRARSADPETMALLEAA